MRNMTMLRVRVVVPAVAVMSSGAAATAAGPFQLCSERAEWPERMHINNQ
jgi:hypothetical protein